MTTVVERMLTDWRPRTRHTVGFDTWIGSHLLAHLPDSLPDWLQQPKHTIRLSTRGQEAPTVTRFGRLDPSD